MWDVLQHFSKRDRNRYSPSYSPETFLSCCIPDLQFDFLSWNFNYPRAKFNSNCVRTISHDCNNMIHWLSTWFSTQLAFKSHYSKKTYRSMENTGNTPYSTNLQVLGEIWWFLNVLAYFIIKEFLHKWHRNMLTHKILYLARINQIYLLQGER